MPIPKGHDCGGMTTIARLKDRCVIDDETGCWNYNGHKAKSDHTQSLWLPALGKTLSLGAAVGYLTTGKQNSPGKCWAPMCGNRYCGNPKHRKHVSMSELPGILASHGLYQSPTTALKISRKRCATSKWSDAQIEAVRSAEGPEVAIAKAHGMSQSHVNRIRSGKARVLAGNPFAGLIPVGLFRGGRP